MTTTEVAGERADLAGTRELPPVRDSPHRAPASDASPRGREGSRFRPDIEGLRAVAVIVVVLYHAGVQQLPGGFVGVDVFFVISGFLIMSQLVREVEVSGRLRVGRFYARRVLRLLPAATLVLAATLLTAWWWLPATRLQELARDAIAANGYVLNYRLARAGTDYSTATGPSSPLQHFWSLAVEEQFYLVVPVLVLLVLVRARSRAGLVVALVAVTAASLAWSVRSTGPSPVWAYFGAPTRVWELGAGALLAVAAGTGVLAGRPRAWGPVLRWTGIALIGYAVLTFGETTAFPGWLAIVPVAGAVLVITGGGVSSGQANDGELAWPGGFLGHPMMRAIGARSYSWYLWHWPVLLIGPFALSREIGPVGKLVLVAVAFGLAAVTYDVVERPVREARELRDHPWQAGALGLALTAGVVVLALLVPMLPSRTPLGMGSVETVVLSGNASARVKALAQKIKVAGSVTSLPANLTPPLKKAARDDPAIYRNGCHLEVADLKTPRRCESLGAPGAKKTIVLFGDSHAAQWFPALNAIAKKRNLRLAVFTKGACSAADVMIYLPVVKRAYRECVTWRKSALTRIRALRPSIVVTSSNADGGDPQGLGGGLDSQWTKAWSRTVDRLASRRTRVVYLNDTPWPRTNVPECLAQNPRAITTCAQGTKRAADSARRSMMARAVTKAGATVVDPMPWFCSLKTCPVVVGNILVYKDDSHISTVYARLLAPILSERLKIP